MRQPLIRDVANERVLALDSVMNQRRRLRKTVLVQGGGAKRAKTELALRSDSWGKSTGLRAEPSGAERSRAEPSGASLCM